MANSTTPRRTGQPRRATGNARTGFTPRPRQQPARRGKQQPSKGGGVLSAVMKALPSAGTAKAKAKSGGKRPGGLALLAGAGGLAAAVSQRNRLKGMLPGRGGDAQSSTGTATVTDPVATVSGPDAAATVTDGPAGTQPGPNAV
jgi:hypothetical protein